jgi:RNA polymerase sigma-70 factor (ECF subfamily)
MTDEKILVLLKNDPGSGLSAVVEKYSAYLLKIVNIKLKDVCTEQDIEEAVSDIFMEFYQSGGKCGFEITSIKAYIAVIARRYCSKVFTRAAALPETLSYDESENYISAPVQSEMHEQLRTGIAKLGQPDEEIFVRKYFLGQKTKDIAKDMKIKVNTVDKRVSRGLVRLKKLLEEGTV